MVEPGYAVASAETCVPPATPWPVSALLSKPSRPCRPPPRAGGTGGGDRKAPGGGRPPVERRPTMSADYRFVPWLGLALRLPWAAAQGHG